MMMSSQILRLLELMSLTHTCTLTLANGEESMSWVAMLCLLSNIAPSPCLLENAVDQEDRIFFVIDYPHPMFSPNPLHASLYNMGNGRI